LRRFEGGPDVNTSPLRGASDLPLAAQIHAFR
jgi:hypothetical protein